MPVFTYISRCLLFILQAGLKKIRMVEELEIEEVPEII